jgi:hypothetical protein
MKKITGLAMYKKSITFYILYSGRSGYFSSEPGKVQTGYKIASQNASL